MMRILIIEDDPKIVDFLNTAFQIGWPEVELIAASKGEKGIELARNKAPDIILLDLSLPDISGYKVLKQIRQFSYTPIIILTVNSEEHSVVKGFTLGANDYVIKPLRPLELIARMKALVNKSNQEEDLSISCGDMHFGASLHEFFKGVKKISLTDIEGRILYILIKNKGKVVSYSSLASTLWGNNYPGARDSLKAHICHLRQKIEDEPNMPKLIINRPTVGYILKRAQ